MTDTCTIHVYPNPFTFATTISFSLQQDSPILIELYDVTGRKVRVVLNKTLAEGINVVNLNRDRLSPGFYFVKLSKDGEVMMKKVLVE